MVKSSRSVVRWEDFLFVPLLVYLRNVSGIDLCNDDVMTNYVARLGKFIMTNFPGVK